MDVKGSPVASGTTESMHAHVSTCTMQLSVPAELQLCLESASLSDTDATYMKAEQL